MSSNRNKNAKSGSKSGREDPRPPFEKAPFPYQTVDGEGKIRKVNEAWRNELGYDRKEVLGQSFGDFIANDSKESFQEQFTELKNRGAIQGIELELKRKNGTPIEASLSGKAHYDEEGNFLKAYCALHELEANGRESLLDSERAIILRLLGQLNDTTDLRTLMEEATRLMKEWSRCGAVGIRLREGEDYPYFETRGFPSQFVQAESSLCNFNIEGEVMRDSEGKPLLECMCGNVIRGNYDSTRPFYTEKGSFWTNSTTELLDSIDEVAPSTRTRGRCNVDGYESVALIPLQYGTENIGLLQFNDTERGKFDINRIRLFQHLADNLALAIKQRRDALKLQESERRFRTVFEEGTVGITLIDLEFNYVEVNSRYTQLVGYPKEELKSMSFTDLTHPEDIDKDKQNAEKLRDGEISYYRTEKRYIRNDGEQIWCDVMATLVRDQEGKPSYFLSMVQDITERKKAEEELRDVNQKLRSIVENTSEAIYIKGREGRYQLINRAAAELFELDRNDIIGKDDYDLFEQQSAVEIREVDRQIMETGDPMTKEAVHFINGERYVFLDDKYPYRNDKGEIIGVIGVSHDITARKKAEVEAKQYREQLQSLSRNLMEAQEEERKQISKELHDEISQIVTGISMHLSAINQTLSADYTPQIEDLLKESLKLTQDLSDQLDEMVHSLRPVMLDDLGLVPTVNWYARDFEERTGVSVKVDTTIAEGELSEKVESVLYRIIHDALSNLEKRSAKAEQVDISFQQKENSVKVILQDRGRGFDLAEETPVSAEERSFGLTGMRERLSAVDGKLKVESAKGEPTRLEISVPLEEQ